MVKVVKVGTSSLSCLVLGIIIGAIISAASFTILISYRIDQYHKKIKELESEIEDRDTRLDRLEASINKQKFVLKDIEVFLNIPEDEIDKITLRKHIEEKYQILLGKEAKYIDAEMVAQVIDGRIFKLEKNKEYKLAVDKLVLTDTLKLWIDVTPLNQT